MNFNVCAFGAIPDGTTSCTHAFNNAIQACNTSGGGIVDVPAGTYLCGTIQLLDNVILNLLPGSTVIGSLDINDYRGVRRGCAWGGPSANYLDFTDITDNPCSALIIADRCTNCGIIGTGKLDGRRSTSHGYNAEKGRPFLVVFSECSNVTLRDVTLTNPGMFTVYSLNCTDMVIDGVKIRTAESWNGDGLDFDGGKRITISNCIIDAGDDGIGLKTLTPGEPCEDFTITNCVIRAHNWGAIRIGPESAADMRRIQVSNCTFLECDTGIKLQLTQDSVFEDFSFDNIVMKQALRPILLTSNRYNMSSQVKEIRPRAGKVRRIRFSNVTAHMPTNCIYEEWNLNIRPGVFISALPNDTVEDISFSNVHLIAPGGGTDEEAYRTFGHGEMYDYWYMYPEHFQNIGDYPGATVYVRNAANVRFTDCIFECRENDKRAAIAAECVENLRIRDAEVRNCYALLRHYRCDGLRITDCADGIIEFDEQQKENWEKFRELSLLVDGMLEEMALTVGNVFNMETTETFDTPIFDLISTPERKQYLLITNSLGNFDLYVNGECVANWRMPSCYVTPYPFAFCLSGLLRDGTNQIALRPQGQFELKGKLLIKSE